MLRGWRQSIGCGEREKRGTLWVIWEGGSVPGWPLRHEEICPPASDTAEQCTANLDSDNSLENMKVLSFSRVPRPQIQITLFIEEQKRQTHIRKQAKQGRMPECRFVAFVRCTWGRLLSMISRGPMSLRIRFSHE